ncbi:hypothetical protein M8818_000629 [Zalaria obscura]|uniref:Uncharacterized protein n=1 Tax=Zalaria obscura TaxID=2024903 RepID=A0ACC3SPQ6_9PEZI
MLHLDGRKLEGGGQLLRISLCLSALTGTPVKIVHIRGNRSGGGGLKAQHLACVKWLAAACGAEVEGAELKSKTLVFKPAGEMDAVSPAYKQRRLLDDSVIYETRLDIGSPGSIGLALQAVLPFILLSPPQDGSVVPSLVHLTITGGTNVSQSPSYDYIEQVLLPMLEDIGIPPVKFTLDRRGWSTGRAGIGSVTFHIQPLAFYQPLPAFELLPPETAEPSSPGVLGKTASPARIDATLLTHSSALCQKLKSAVEASVQTRFGEHLKEDTKTLNFRFDATPAASTFYLLLVATLPHGGKHIKLGCDCLWEKKVTDIMQKADQVAKAVTQRLAAEVKSRACVDEHMRNQLVVFQALAEGRSHIYAGESADGEAREASLHTQTAEWVAAEFLGVEFGNGTGNGIGYVRARSSSVNEEEDMLVQKLDRVELEA